MLSWETRKDIQMLGGFYRTKRQMTLLALKVVSTFSFLQHLCLPDTLFN